MRLMNRKIMLWLLCLSLMLTGSLMAAAQGSASVSGFVFIDRDLDGRFSGSEYLLAGVELWLMQGEGLEARQLGAMTTGADGRYSFAGLSAGDYYIRVTLPNDHVFASFTDGGSRALPMASSEGRTVRFSLSEGQQSVDEQLIGAITKKTGSFVRVVAFGDLNANGGRFSNEPLLRGVEAQVQFEHEGVWYTIAQELSNKEGIATMSGIAPGNYVLAAQLPEPYIVGPLGQKINLFYNSVVPSGESFGRSEPFQLPARGSVGMGIGGVLTGSAQGRVFEDSNFNGIMDAGEPGLAGIEVRLRHQEMAFEKTALTDAGGNYSFTHLNGGEYTLSVTLPESQMFTRAGSTLLSSDTARSASAHVSIAVEQTLPLQPIGVIPNTSLKLQAFHDSNLNGLMDAGEPPFAGARLEVLSGGRAVATQETDAQGIALLPLLRGDDLQLRLSLPDGQIFSVSGDEGGNAFVDSLAQSQLTIPYSLQPGTQGELLAGATLPALISGRLYEDMNSNGLHEADEGFVAGFTVQAIDAQGQVAAQTLSAADGAYTLSPLIPGEYRLRVLLQSPYIFSQAPGGSDELVNRITSQTAEHGDSEPVSLAAGQSQTAMDAAIFRSGVIQGAVLLGDELDGFAGQQGGLSDVQVALLDEDGLEVSEYTVATTDDKGQFLLKGALPGSYMLRYSLPADAAFSQPLSDEMVHIGPLFEVKAADELQAPVIYAVKTGSYMGQAYLDLNVNGQFDDQDSALPGVALSMESEDASRNQQTQSLEDGSFVIRGLRPGDYSLKVQLPEGKLVSFDKLSPLSPGTTSSSAADVSIGMGQVQEGHQIAAVNAHQLSGQLYFDDNLSSALEAGEPGFAAELKLRHVLSSVAFTATADASGAWQVPLLFPGDYQLSLSLPDDMVLFAPQGKQNANSWELPLSLASDQAATTQNLGLVRFGSIAGAVWNMDGSMDDVGQLSLSLLQDGKVVQQTQTDAQGAYQFTKLYPGQYSLEVLVKEGFRFARLIDSENTRFSLITQEGSQVALERGVSAPLTLTMAEHKTGQDVGTGRTGTLGDFAWLDLDQDGMQDAGEPGVPGIEIRLYQFGQVAGQTTTNAYGRYQFSELFPGSYRLEATMPPELKATKQQSEFRLVASILPQMLGTTVSAENVIVPSGGRNLNADLGFALVRDGELPASMQHLPQKDWTPLVPTVPKRMR